MSFTKSRLGKLGEDIAEKFYRKRGYKVLDRNFRTKRGEIDLIVEKNNQVIFVEVKTRTGERYGEPREFVYPSKQKKMVSAANRYLTKNKLWRKNIRFDIIGIIKHGDKIKIEHEKDVITIGDTLDCGNTYWQPW